MIGYGVLVTDEGGQLSLIHFLAALWWWSNMMITMKMRMITMIRMITMMTVVIKQYQGKHSHFPYLGSGTNLIMMKMVLMIMMSVRTMMLTMKMTMMMIS